METPIPGLAHSSPVVWGDSVFLTTAVNEKGGSFLKVGLYGSIDPVPDEGPHRFVVYRIDKRTGKILWERTAHEGVPRRPRHPKATLANSTPATDGERVVAFFGSEGLYCYDMDGKLLWKKDFGPLDAAFFVAPDAQWGFASSPVIHDGVVYIQCDVLNDPFLAAFDLETGDADLADAARRRPHLEHAHRPRDGRAGRSSWSTAGSTSGATTPPPARRSGG